MHMLGVGELENWEAVVHGKKVERSQRGHALPLPRRHAALKFISIIENLRLNAELTCIRKHSWLPFIKRKKKEKISGRAENQIFIVATLSQILEYCDV